MKLSTIINEQANLAKLLELKLPVKVAYRLNKLNNKFNSEVKFFNDKRNELINELGEKKLDAEGKETEQIEVKKENLAEFYKKLNEIVEVETEVNYEPISISELGDIVIEPKLLSETFFKE